MAKGTKPPKQVADLSKRVIKSSMSGNPKPKQKQKKRRKGVAPIKKIHDPDFLSESWSPPGPDLRTNRKMKKWLEEAFGAKIKGNYKVHFENGFIYTATLMNGETRTMTQSEFWSWSKRRTKAIIDKVQMERQIKKED